MFSSKLLVALLSLSFTAFTAQAAPANRADQCVTVAVRTVTVTAAAVATPPAANNGSKGGNKGNTKTTTSAAAVKTTAKGATKATTTAKAAATSLAAGNNAGGGNAAGNGNAGNANSGKGNTGNNAGNANTGNAGKGNTGNNAGNANTGNAGNANTGNANAGNPQTSLTLDPRVLAPAFANDGQDVPAAGQVPSLTSTNNFINFCLTVPNLPITNGKQTTTGSCNPAPIGVIPSTDNMPSAKFQFPANFGTLKANQAFTIKLAIKNLQTGFFTNAQESYFSAPQQLNAQGQIQGHSHVVIEQLSSLFQTTPTDPKKFAFFKGLNGVAQGGVLTADVTAGLPVGFYKVSTINSAANHQPVIAPVAQHGSLDDVVYFSVTTSGQPVSGGNNAANNNGGKNLVDPSGAAGAGNSTAPAAASSAAPAASASAQGSKGGKSASTGKNRFGRENDN